MDPNSIWFKCAEKTTLNGKDHYYLTIQCAPVLIGRLIEIGWIASGTVALIFIIRAGYMYIMSNGDPKQATTAKQTMTYAIIGLIVILLSYFALVMISAVTGIDCILKIGFSVCDAP